MKHTWGFDDLITKVQSLIECLLSCRIQNVIASDNADFRLTAKGHEIGLASELLTSY
jgi:tRNA U34 5-carboxymethylaminomethyl modifying enzyme MnmG/GidA